MHLVKPAARPQVESELDASAFSSVYEGAERLLRMKGHFPETYGFVMYIDPYLDFISLSVLTSDGTATSWAGTHQQYDGTWEPFLVKGAT